MRKRHRVSMLLNASLYPNFNVFSSPEILQPFKVYMEASLSMHNCLPRKLAAVRWGVDWGGVGGRGTQVSNFQFFTSRLV